jgi:uncharacterized membrane protein
LLLKKSKRWIEYLAVAVEIAVAAVVGLASGKAALRAVLLFLRRGMPPQAKVVVRLALGRWLGLGLEFVLAADILRTAIAPAWHEIQLANAFRYRVEHRQLVPMEDQNRCRADEDYHREREQFTLIIHGGQRRAAQFGASSGEVRSRR